MRSNHQDNDCNGHTVMVCNLGETPAKIEHEHHIFGAHRHTVWIELPET